MNILFAKLAATIILMTVFTAEGQESVQCPYPQSSYRQNMALPEHQEGYQKVSGGSMFFRYFNLKPGPLVILVPGLPSAVYYSDLSARLVDAGYNVLSFDYPGKMNSKLRGKENLNFIIQQIEELFQVLQVYRHQDWHVIGTSMGGVVAARLAVEHPEVVRTMTLLNPVGLKRDWTVVQRLAGLPVLNKILAPFILKGQVKKDIKSALACPQNYENLLSEQDTSLATFQNRWNYLNLINNFSMVDNTDVYKRLANEKIPVLITSGQAGTDPLYDQIDQLKKVLPQANFINIPRTSHIPFVENPAVTFSIIQLFLKNPLPQSSKLL